MADPKTIQDILYGLKQIKKNLILLQDHSTSYPCPSCMKKHLLTVEGYAEELIPMMESDDEKRFLIELRTWAQLKRLQLGAML